MTDKIECTPAENALRVAIAQVEALAYRLKESCPHRIGRLRDSAKCAICDRHFGWWCPDSPDSVCHYYPDFGVAMKEPKIILVDKTIISVPADKADDNYSDDWCIFCGSPEERK